jgi:thiol:disulfide interchange protein DsbA
MKRIAILLVALLSLLPLSSAMAEEFKEGVHYIKLDNPQPPIIKSGKVEILEFFWYGCPHCFRLEPFIERLEKRMPAGAEFVRVPAVFRPSWEPHARAFYSAKLLGVLHETHKPLFNAIHLEKRNLGDQESLMKFYADFGVEKTKFIKTYGSFAVQTRVRQAKRLVGRYAIQGVPAIAVAGKYMVTAKTAGSNAKMLKVIRHLVEKETK